MGAFTEHGMTLTDGETVTVKLDIIAIKVFWHGERLKNLKARKKMKINAKRPSIKTYTLSHFKIGEVCMVVRDEHYYLVVKSEKEKKQIVDLTENEIIRDAGYMRFIPATAELNIKDVG